MSARSTRNKIRWALEKGSKYPDKIAECLTRAMAASQGRVPELTQATPKVMTILLELKDTLTYLRECV